MTRKDYRAAAKIIAEEFVGNQKMREVVCETFAIFFLEDNARFDTERFRKACNKEES